MDPSLAKDISSISKIDAVRRILDVICQITGMGFSAVARVTEAKWIACAVKDDINFGLLPGGELDLESTICNEIRDSGRLVVIDHVAEDDVFRNHHTPKIYGFQSYISVPITLPTGRFFGTLCAIDPKPAHVNTPEIIGMFQLFADLIAQHLDSQERMAASEAALLNERETAKLRDQFIAVLGHDLRNPLAALDAGIEVMRDGEENAPILDLMRRSTRRMAELIGNVLDFARGRLGNGLTLERTSDTSLEATLQQVVTELRSSSPGRVIESSFDLQRSVYCEKSRLGQMLSNLLANALTHGDPNSPVRVCAQSSDAGFELRVTNQGKTIEPHIIEQLFEPFARGSARPGQEGLGLGLYICSEIARAHHGTLGVTSKNGETCFTFHMLVEVE